MNKIVKPVPEDLLIRASAAAANGPRGYENAMISMIKALSNEANLITDLMPDFCEACERGIVRREQSKGPPP